MTLPWESLLAVAGLAQLLLPAVMLQVPARLGWSQDLSKLQPMNRKLFWTYAGFTAFTVVALGVLTLALRSELARGGACAVGLLAFTGLYWAARLGVDVWFGHRGWPRGRTWAAAHVLLDLLFACLAAVCLGLAARHVGWI